MAFSFRDQAESWLTSEQDAASNHPLPIGGAAADHDGSPNRQVAKPQTLAEPIGGDRSDWPGDLPAFRDWWLSDPSLGEAGAYPRVPPIGEAGADIMLLVPMPEDVDRERLLSGPAGRMAASVLRAAGVPQGSAYFASVLPRHTPLPDWSALASRGLGDIVAHHIGLAQPKKVLVFGRLIAGLVENDAQTLCAPGLDELERSAQRRRRFWARWLDWTGS